MYRKLGEDRDLLGIALLELLRLGKLCGSTECIEALRESPICFTAAGAKLFFEEFKSSLDMKRKDLVFTVYMNHVSFDELCYGEFHSELQRKIVLILYHVVYHSEHFWKQGEDDRQVLLSLDAFKLFTFHYNNLEKSDYGNGIEKYKSAGNCIFLPGKNGKKRN